MSLSAQLLSEAARYLERDDDFGLLMAQHVEALAVLVRKVETPGARPLSVGVALARMACDRDCFGDLPAIRPGAEYAPGREIREFTFQMIGN